MPHYSKIASCCYCGTRAALVLRGETRHELACASCGAPLHDLKQMPRPTGDPQPARPAAAPALRRKVKSKKNKSKKRRSRRSDWIEDIFDVIEDIFD
ncbi:hypothetical protein [Shimia aestuarii]|uniref:TFIIB zinc-binding n=1 Tax=Shimia aestuarii TaxID=254406 RepID=A0A1I4QSN3_9RHOB|nr:hypothetical protein [Shimia aestuarii]SFM43064.1 hypothetical protein SAMN04488042_107112 [Shimia aestuarii]